MIPINKVFTLAALTVFAWLFFTSIIPARAAPGALDPSFAGGSITPPLGDNYLSASSIAVQSDGKFLVGGVYSLSTSQPFPYAQFALVRYLPTGLVDADFGTQGTVITSFDEFRASFMSLNDVTVLPNGKIVAVGSGRILDPATSISRISLFVVRYNADGSLDMTFNNTGKFMSSIGGFQTVAQTVAAQSDGKFVVAGYGGGALKTSVPYKALVLRFSDSGLDASFGSGGIFLSQIPNVEIRAGAVAVQPDGRILFGGFASNKNSYGMCLGRLTTTGSPDKSFGNAGLNFAVGLNEATDIIVQPDGKIAAVGSAGFGNGRDAAILRFESNGAPDLSFGKGGKVVTNISGISDYPVAGALQPDGKIVVAGYSSNDVTASDFKPILARYNSNGALDTNFGTAGMATTPTGFSFYDMKILPDGKILTVSGTSVVGVNLGFRAMRYLGDAPFTQRTANFDFDGDGWADFAVFRNLSPDILYWSMIENPSLSPLIFQDFGAHADLAAPADYDGDRKTDLAYFSPANGHWRLRKSIGNVISTVEFGQAGDVPVPADYDGDGKADIAAFRRGIWHIIQSGNGSLRVEQFGYSTDKPVMGDFNGDGKNDLAVYRNGFWYIQKSQQGLFTQKFGLRFDKPVPADYDGDGITDLAVFRPSEGTWHILASTDGYSTEQFGVGTDYPVPADYDGDGKTDIAIHRGNTWFMKQSSSGFRAVVFGFDTDIPVHSVFIR